MFFIYVLVDPSDPRREPRYVGQTKNPSSRLQSHRYTQREVGYGAYADNWLRSLAAPVEMEIIEETDDEDYCDFLEIFYIDLYRKHSYSLTNTLVGGDFADHRRMVSLRAIENRLAREREERLAKNRDKNREKNREYERLRLARYRIMGIIR